MSVVSHNVCKLLQTHQLVTCHTVPCVTATQLAVLQKSAAHGGRRGYQGEKTKSGAGEYRL